MSSRVPGVNAPVVMMPETRSATFAVSLSLTPARRTAWEKLSPLPTATERSICGRSGVSLSGDRSEEHTSELQSLMRISYAIFCLKNKDDYASTKPCITHTEDNQEQVIHNRQTHV